MAEARRVPVERALESERVVVVGAGIAGLTAGFRLREAGFDVSVFEAGEHAGGRMSTVVRDGFVMDTAAGWLGSKYGRMRQLAADAGVGDQLRSASDSLGFYKGGAIHIVHSKRLTDLIRTPLLSHRSKLAAVKIVADVVRHSSRLHHGELTRSAGLDSETVLEYARRKNLPDELLYDFIDPVVRASLLNTVERMSIVDLLFVFRNFLNTGFMNAPSGIGFLPRALAGHLKVELSARVTNVEERSGHVALTWERPGEPERTETASACVIALSGHQMLAIYPQLDDARRQVITALEYSKALNIHVALDRVPPTPAMYVQIPASEHPDLVAVGVDHNKMSGRAPAGKGLLSSMWSPPWCDKRWDRDDDEIVSDALAGLRLVFPEVDEHACFASVSRWSPALLLSRRGTYRNLLAFHEACRPTDRIQFAGDYFGGNSTNASLCSGERAARRLIEAMQGRAEHG